MCDKSEDKTFWPVCCDCKTKIEPGTERKWRWYDFYAAQGDEPFIICAGCWDAPRHQWRMEQDRKDRMDELGR